MARGKKNNELTPEERLQQALVPEEEWPYQLPEGWKWVYLGGIADEVTDKTDIFNDQTVKYIGLENIASNNGINGWQSTVGIKSTKTVFNTGDILYGKLRPYLNKHDGNITMSVNFESETSPTITSIAVYNVDIESKKRNNWSGLGENLPFYSTLQPDPQSHGDIGKAGKVKYVIFKYDEDGNIIETRLVYAS